MTTYRLGVFAGPAQPDESIMGEVKYNQCSISLRKSGTNYAVGDYLDISIIPPYHQISDFHATWSSEVAARTAFAGRYELYIVDSEVGEDHAVGANDNAILLARWGTGGSTPAPAQQLTKDVPGWYQRSLRPVTNATSSGGLANTAQYANTQERNWLITNERQNFKALTLRTAIAVPNNDEDIEILFGWNWQKQQPRKS